MSVKKLISAALVTLGATVGAVGLIEAPASAGSGGCTLGYACLWQDLYYDGRSYGKKFDGPVVSTMDDRASSAAANGRSCGVTRFYDHPYKGGKYFILNSEHVTGTNYRDPDLRNGAGVGPNPHENWNDRISYIYFDRCS